MHKLGNNVKGKCLKVVAAATMSLAFSCASAFAVNVTANTSVNVRSGPDNSRSVVTVMDAGSSAEKLGTSGNWVKLSVNGKTGYVYSKYLSNSGTGGSASASTSDSGSSNSNATGTVYISASSLNVRSGPSTSYGSIGSLKYGTAVAISGTSGSWYKISYNGQVGYISRKYTTANKLSSSSSSTSSASESSSNASDMVSYAKQFLGLPYVYGGNGPNSFDCSGFTCYVYSHFGKSLPRSSASQYSNCTKISKSELRAGDLVFFSNDSSGNVGHVAIYMGNGMIIHAANSKSGVCTDNMNSKYYTEHYIGSGRY